MKFTPGHALLSGFAAVLLLGSVEWFSWRHTTRAVETAAMLTSSHRVRDDLGRLLALILDLDAWQRTNLLADDPPALRPLEEGLKSVAEQQRALEQLILPPDQKADATALGPLLAEWSVLVRRNVELRRNAGSAAVRQQILTGRASVVLEQIRARFARMDASASALANQRSIAARQEASNARLLIAAAIGLSFALLIAVLGLALHGNRRRQQTGQASHKTNEKPEQRVWQRVPDPTQTTDVPVTTSPSADAAGGGIGASTLSRDITEKIRAKETLRDSEERFRTLANSIPQLAWIAQADGYTIWYNRRWYEYTGTTPEQMEGWGWQSVHDPEWLPEVMQNWTAAIDSRQPFDMEFPLRGADGRFRIFLTRVQPIKDSRDGVVQWFGTNTDVDELKRMEESLRATQARLNSTLEAGSIGTWTWDIGNDRLTADEFTARAFSIEADAAAKGLPAAAYIQAIVEEDQPAVSESLAQAIESCGQYDIEYRVRQKDGALLWLQARGRVEGDAAGNAVSFHGAVMDITARKLAEAGVRQSEEHFRFLNDLGDATRTLADPAQIMAVMARMLGEHLRASRCAYADVEKDSEHFTILHDYTDGCASTVGRYLLSLFGSRAVATLRNGKTLIIRNVEAELLPDEGADMFNAIGIRAIITCPLVKDGVLRAMMAVHQTTARDWKPNEIAMVQDVVERCWATIERRAAEEKVHQLNVELEQRVIERTAQLEAVNRELEAFSYTVSHDLRAPLRAVDGYSQAVIEDFGPQLPAEGQRQLQTIRDSAQRMGELIDDLLTFARLNRQQLEKRAIDTGLLVRGTLDELGFPWPQRQIELRLGDLPASSGDPALLKQVWLNLLSNALKYTRKQEKAVVEIGCMQTNGVEIFFVRDNGTGFDMRYADKLFGVFQRLHRAEDFEGTGVGLAIVQRIINRHGGSVWANAAVDRGATFYFTLEREAKP